MGAACGVLHHLSTHLHQDLWQVSSGSLEQRVEALQCSPAVSTAALRVTLELQLLVAQQVRAMQQQAQSCCAGEEPGPEEQQQQKEALADWLILNRAIHMQVSAAVAAGGGSLQQLQQ
jgi:hypothetical protein